MGFFPPVLIAALLFCLRPLTGFTGRYKSWEMALGESKSYEDPLIIEMFRSKVQARTSSLVHEMSSTEARLATAIYRVYLEIGSQGPISVLDIGGATGEHRDLFDRLKVPVAFYEIQESPAVVDALSEFSNSRRSWVYRPSRKKYDLLLCSGTLQVLEEGAANLKSWTPIADFILLDRTPIFADFKDRIVKQNVLLGPGLFKRRTSYPGWFFSHSQIQSQLPAGSEVLLKWKVPEDSPVVGWKRRSFSGLLIKVESHVVES